MSFRVGSAAADALLIVIATCCNLSIAGAIRVLAAKNTDITATFKHILHELEKPFNLEAAKEFLKITSQLDILRNEDTFKILPEMEDVRRSVLKTFDV